MLRLYFYYFDTFPDCRRVGGIIYIYTFRRRVYDHDNPIGNNDGITDTIKTHELKSCRSSMSAVFPSQKM